MLTRTRQAAYDSARALIPAPVRRTLVDLLGRRRFIGSMITRESGVQRFIRRTFTRRRPVLRHLDVHVTDHCNLGCRSCEHYSPICTPWFADPDVLSADFARLAQLFESIEQIFLLGGEPLLHPRVEEFVHIARKAFPDARLCLMTNGLLVTRMQDAVWRALHDCHAVLLCDDYPIDLPKERIAELAAEHDVSLEWMPPATEFFRAPIDASGSCDPERAFTACQLQSNCAIMRDGRMYACAHIAYADAPADRFGLPQILPTPEDSIALAEARDGDEVIRFLTRPAPWCRFCEYEHVEPFEWARTGRTADEWVSERRPASSTGGHDG